MKNLRWKLEQVRSKTHQDFYLYESVVKGVVQAIELSDSNLRDSSWIYYEDQVASFLYCEERP